MLQVVAVAGHAAREVLRLHDQDVAAQKVEHLFHGVADEQAFESRTNLLLEMSCDPCVLAAARSAQAMWLLVSWAYWVDRHGDPIVLRRAGRNACTSCWSISSAAVAAQKGIHEPRLTVPDRIEQAFRIAHVTERSEASLEKVLKCPEPRDMRWNVRQL
jgi:hypothetical protein